jgi:hypothetical protein
MGGRRGVQLLEWLCAMAGTAQWGIIIVGVGMHHVLAAGCVAPVLCCLLGCFVVGDTTPDAAAAAAAGHTGAAS